MKFTRARYHSIYQTWMILALLSPITTKDVQENHTSVSCKQISSTNSKINGSFANQISFFKTTKIPVYYSNDQNKIVPAASPDMIILARELLREKEAVAFCRSRKLSIVNTKGGKECRNVTVTWNSTHLCSRKITIQIKLKEGNDLVDQSKETIIFIAGNVFGFLFLFVLLTTYIYFKELQTSYGQCVVILSIVVIIKDIMQLIAYASSKKKTSCKIVGVTSHWSHLSMFGWMASIAFDLLVTFWRIRIPSPVEQKRRVRRYVAFSFAVPSLIVFICLVIDISKAELYGLRGVCFISHHTANTASFTVPVVAVLFFNIVCLVCTIYHIRSANKASKSLSANDERRPSISFTIMTVKLSLLLGLGWVIGYIGCILHSSALLYTFLVMDSFQGVFIYIAFCGNQRVFRFYKRSINHRLQRIKSSSSKRETNEIDL